VGGVGAAHDFGYRHSVFSDTDCVVLGSTLALTPGDPAEIRALHYNYPEDLETELLVGPPPDDIYTLYLQAKIDEANGEYNKYSNTMQIYNEYYGTFLRWFCGQYDPAQGYIGEEARARDGTV